MKKKIIAAVVFILTITSFGFYHLDKESNSLQITPELNSVSATPIYEDNFNNSNDTTSLRNRGYKIFNNSVPVGTSSWFQGSTALFNAYNGPLAGYVAASYSSTGNVGNIDVWLITPRVSGGILSGDSLYFWCRSSNQAATNFADSVRVMYSAPGDSIVNGEWLELGRFRSPNPPLGPNGGWVRFGFRAPSNGANGRFAIRYNVVNGGINGVNSNYIGIDALTIERVIAPPASKWFVQNSGLNTSLNSVNAPTNNVAWIAGNSGKVLRTTNGGTWVNASGDLSSTTDFVNIWGVDANFALVTGTTGSSAFVYRTFNGGTNWNQVFTQAAGHINAIGMKDVNNGFMTGNPVNGRWSLWKTTDGGSTWDSAGLRLQQAGSESGLNNSLFVTGNNIWFGTNNNRVYYSSNNGTSWVAQSNSLTETNSIWFNNSQTGLCGGSELRFTGNSGGAWTPQTTLGTGIISGLTGTGNIFWMTRVNNNFIYRTTDNGSTWQNDFNAAVSFSHISISRNGSAEGNVWAVTSAGGIYKYGANVSISPINEILPDKYFLSQNYPNPFNPSTKINFSIPQQGFTMLKIYSMNGREVSSSVNEELPAGNYTVNFNGSVLSSGIYFYVLRSANYTSVKKLALVK